jgi:hypothetical protein
VSTLLVDLGAWTAAPTAVLAQDPAPPPGEGPEFGKASPVALVVIVLLGIATVLLIRSMTKHLRRVPASFDEPAAEETKPSEDADASAAGAEPGREPAEASNGDRSDPPGTKPA